VATHPDANVEVVDLELSDLASVRRAAEVVSQEPKLDVLVNNAGVMWTPRMLTVDGFEWQFGINHLGHFALTSLLLPLLEAPPDSRVVTVSSSGHKLGNGDLDWDDISGENSYSRAQSQCTRADRRPSLAATSRVQQEPRGGSSSRSWNAS